MAGIRLVGEDPLQVERLWRKIYEGTIYHGRLGAGIMLMSAIDNALHDLRGRLLKQPVYKLLGGAVREKVSSFFTLFPGMVQGRSWDEMQTACFSSIEKATEHRARAFKMEMLSYDLVSDRELVRFPKMNVDTGHYPMNFDLEKGTGLDSKDLYQEIRDVHDT